MEVGSHEMEIRVHAYITDGRRYTYVRRGARARALPGRDDAGT